MYQSALPITKKIEFANSAINNALNNADINTALDAFGYDTATLNEGKTLLESFKVLHTQQQQEYIEQRAATSTRDTIRAAIEAIYSKHLKLARVTFKREPNTLIALDLVGDRLRTYDGWKGQVTTFYNAAVNNTAIKDGLARFKVTDANLSEVQTKLGELETAEAAQKIEIGEAQQASLDRDTALEALDDWMSDFQEVAKIALEDSPQRLEALGIMVRR
jgi:hypothetical protein